MKAIFFEKPRKARMIDITEPRLDPGWVLVRTRLTGICGSDMHAYLGSQPFFAYPQIPGHEAVGEVVRAIEVRTLEVGQRVVLDPAVNCGRCRPCRIGRYNCCCNIRVIGVHTPGTMADMFAAPAERLHPVPDSVPDEIAVLAEPLSIALHATHRAHLKEGEQVAIIGAGPIGLSLVVMAKARGATCAISDIEPARLRLAKQLGADLTLNPTEIDVAAKLQAWTKDEGVSTAFEAVGTPTTIRLAAEITGPGGRVVILGLCQQEVTLSGSSFVRKELEVVGSRLHHNTIQQVLEMLARGDIQPAALLSEVRPLAAYQSAFTDLQHNPGSFVKIALRPNS